MMCSSTFRLLFRTIAAFWVCSIPNAEGKGLRGPIEATVVRVIDGDTFVADALVWPGQTIRVNIRIRGIDAPEMKARCVSEREAAERARDELAGLLGVGTVAISDIAGAKYYGRVLADVANSGGVLIGPAMIGRKLVRPYKGGKRERWCE